MNKGISKLSLAARIWFLTCFILAIGELIYGMAVDLGFWYFSIIMLIPSLVGSFPVFVIFIIVLPWIAKKSDSFRGYIFGVSMTCFICTALYGLAGSLLPLFSPGQGESFWLSHLKNFLFTTGILFSASIGSMLLSTAQLRTYFIRNTTFSSIHKQKIMETTNFPDNEQTDNKSIRSNKILFKGAITAGLILIMMIPTVFINNLIQERQMRQESVVKEVDSRWAGEQTLTGPYIFLPYKKVMVDSQNKPYEITAHILIIPDNLHVNGRVEHELRLRSIYKVLLYRASLTEKGNIKLTIPKDIPADLIQWQDARVCFGISDFKGIEEKLVVSINGTENELSPGLPSNEINENGLSASIALSPTDTGKSLDFSMNIKLKGSEMLHFVPFSGNSDFTLESTWPNPSFDGNNLPNERIISDSGFKAKWIFNKANLPFGTVLKDFKFDESSLAFGVTMIQPADQYAKTNRSVKYAILVIGLTFSLFFIIELMQQKPIHPVQYVLIGLALVIFYSLLLSISEFLPFDLAYLIASVSTILLIGLYAKAHFGNWRSAGIFTSILSLLYGFIFVLIRLEDTALLVGSIGLFIILAITMYASKKVNWYGKETLQPQL